MVRVGVYMPDDAHSDWILVIAQWSMTRLPAEGSLRFSVWVLPTKLKSLGGSALLI